MCTNERQYNMNISSIGINNKMNSRSQVSQPNFGTVNVKFNKCSDTVSFHRTLLKLKQIYLGDIKCSLVEENKNVSGGGLTRSVYSHTLATISGATKTMEQNISRHFKNAGFEDVEQASFLQPKA